MERFLSICGDKMSKDFLKFYKLIIKPDTRSDHCLKSQTCKKPNSRISYARLQVRPESLQTSTTVLRIMSTIVKNENLAIGDRISDFAKATYFSTKNPINKLAMNNRRLFIAAEFHFVHSVENDS